MINFDSSDHPITFRVPLQQRQDHSSVEMWLDRFERTHSDLVIMKTEEFREKTLKEIADVRSLFCVPMKATHTFRPSVNKHWPAALRLLRKTHINGQFNRLSIWSSTIW